ncbi:MAG: cadherin domain-containing protein [Alphaproteobacteria bacterium]
MTTTWDVNPEDGYVEENKGVGEPVASFVASDTESNDISYWLTSDDNAGLVLMTIGLDGVIRLRHFVDYEYLIQYWRDVGNYNQERWNNYTVVVNAAPSDRVIDEPALTSLFVLSVVNLHEDGLNDRVARWFVGNPSSATIDETANIGSGVATFSATDPDGPGIDYWLSNTPDSIGTALMMIGGDGVIRLKHQPDYEYLSNYWLSLGITDRERWGNYTVLVNARGRDGGAASGDGTLVISTLFVLSISNVDEYPLLWHGTQRNFLSANEMDGLHDYHLAFFSARDGDNSEISYSLTGDEAALATISIDEDTGELRLIGSFDYEASTNGDGIFSVVVYAHSSDSNESISTIFVLQAYNIDDDTAWMTTSSDLSISETDTANILIGTFLAVDVDGGGSSRFIQYSLSGADADYFYINHDGILTFISSLDFEERTNPIYSIIISARENDGGGVITQNFVLSIDNDGVNDPDVNDQPTIWSDNQTSDIFIIEEDTTDVVITTFTAIDDDGAGISYSITGTDSVYFSIDSDTGILTFISLLDYETVSHQYTITINAIGTAGGDGVGAGGIVLTQNFVVSIGNDGINELNLNDQPTRWADTPSAGEMIDENNASGLILTIFSAIDFDGNNINYSITGTDTNLFTIDSQGALTLLSSLDYEGIYNRHNGNYFTITINAIGTDGGAGVGDGALSISQIFILTLNNQDEPNSNDQMAIWSGTPSTGGMINEDNASELMLATFTAIDADGTDIDYSIIGTDSNLFSIDENGVLILKSSIDYETTYNNHVANYFTITIRAFGTSDGFGRGDGALAITQTFILTVIDDGVDDPNVNDQMAIWSGTPSSGVMIDENNVSELVLTTFTATDADGVGISYSITGDDSDLFTIDDNGVLILKSSIDYEETYHEHRGDYFTITIHALGTGGGQGIGGGALAITQIFILSVGDEDEVDVNDQPTAWLSTPSTGAAINENNAVDVSLATFMATDADGADISYSIAGDDRNLFAIDTAGVLTLKSSIDYEKTYNGHYGNYFTITIHAIGTSGGDGVGDGALILSQTFILTINNDGTNETNLNDQPTEWSGTQNAGAVIDENDVVNVAFATFIATDADGAGIAYSLSGINSNLFSIDNMGGLSLKSTIDYEGIYGGYDGNYFTITINAIGTADGIMVGDGTSAITQIFVLSINNVNDEMTEWSGTQSAGTTVNENNASDLTITTFTAVDTDGADISYSIGGTDSNLFMIDTEGVLTLISSLDYEGTYNGHAGNYFTITINAIGTDGGAGVGDGALSITQTFILSLVDINESPNHPPPNTPIYVDDAIYNGNVILSADIYFSNAHYTNDDGKNYHNLTADNLDDSFIVFTDPDGNQNQYHWYFIQDNANDGTGHIMFDIDGDGTGNDRIYIYGDKDNFNAFDWQSPNLNGEFATPNGLSLDQNGTAALTYQQFLDLVGGQDNINFI